ncbi:MAG: tetratricopeptide repeat protein [Dongiaceae bacterium]
MTSVDDASPADEAATIIGWTTARLATGADAEARAALAAAAVRHPDHAALAARHADALHADGQVEDAAAEYRRALALDASMADAWYGLGCIELGRDAYGEAARCLRQAIAQQPDAAAWRFNLGKALFELGEVDAAVECYRRILDGGDPALYGEALLRIACIIPGAASADNAAVLESRRAWAATEATASARENRQRPPTARAGKLRIGYVSAFFGDRNWMKPVWGAVNHHDRSRFEIHFFVDGKPPTAESGYRDAADDRVHTVTGATNDGLADYIARFGIDVLVDLNGYSFPRRLGLFLRRPAPVIVGWFNMFATTGIDGFDCIVGDDAVIPAAEERFYSERVLRVPGSYLAFSVLYPVPEVAPPPVGMSGTLTFGCFCSQYKITDDTIDAWAAILRGAPQARLRLKNRALGDASTQAALCERFARRDVDPVRVITDGPSEHYAYLAAYDRVDIALDTFPYSGGTTTMEALWQGVPVLTFDGDRWAARTSVSLLRAAGLDSWCLPDRDAFVERAIALANAPTTPTELADLRATLRDRLARSAVCDSAGLCRAFEGIYETIASGVRSQVPKRDLLG